MVLEDAQPYGSFIDIFSGVVDILSGYERTRLSRLCPCERRDRQPRFLRDQRVAYVRSCSSPADSSTVLSSRARHNVAKRVTVISAKKHKAPTPEAPIRNRQTRKVANAKVHNRYTNLT